MPHRALVTGGRVAAATAQYLARFASAEVALAGAVRERYRAALVVPAFRERSGWLAGYRAALEGARGRVLVIVVVNAAEEQALAHQTRHRELLEVLRGPDARRVSSAPPAWLACHGPYDVLAIDRASPEFCLPPRQGVGLARRIGTDVALALYAAGQLELPYLYGTDADACLPRNYFETIPERPAAAIAFSFWHVPGDNARIDAATAVYELGLRYYVAGLAHARSPYAFHALGSCLAIEANAYAAVRGYPKRLSGEDFYVLDKLAKVGSIWRADEARVELVSRASSRTVHGTGVAAVRIADELARGTTSFYHPQIFTLLAHWLEVVDAFVEGRDIARARAELEGRAGAEWVRLEAVLTELGAWDALRRASHEVRVSAALRARLHTWFDGFRTLKLIHGLRRRGLDSTPYRRALAASWSPVAREAEEAPVDELRRRLAQHLSSQPAFVGVALHSHAAACLDATRSAAVSR